MVRSFVCDTTKSGEDALCYVALTSEVYQIVPGDLGMNEACV